MTSLLAVCFRVYMTDEERCQVDKNGAGNIWPYELAASQLPWMSKHTNNGETKMNSKIEFVSRPQLQCVPGYP
ncbi:hypothetical protein OUZ56_007336 [Daphnia magna]|uniref:Uncharacterized protein n=1 Tax=Daphnia magna TaxID=35525 RepID=A0ABQ9YYF4_9CRUS|nr:hypothetical protein OUZ56_007336 [Daphnia magna]